MSKVFPFNHIITHKASMSHKSETQLNKFLEKSLILYYSVYLPLLTSNKKSWGKASKVLSSVGCIGVQNKDRN